ncbi:MAG: ParA family protein, partial [Novosphingobium sp.]|nr:ParA family protein [Novosphingobium sp.]
MPRIPGTSRQPVSAASATIAIYSVKGGVGKTTLATNLAWCSAAITGHRTLLWDLDASGGCGFLVGVDPRASRPAEDIFTQQRKARKNIRHTAFAALDLLPADESLRSLDAQLASIGKRKRLARLTGELARDYTR